MRNATDAGKGAENGYVNRFGRQRGIAMLAAELIVFTLVLFALFWWRQQQMADLNKQALFLRRFAEGVTAWRNKAGIPEGARQAIEVLVNIPIDKRITQACAWSMLHEQGDPNLSENGFWIARSQLKDPEQREAFDWLLQNYFLAMTYSACRRAGSVRIMSGKYPEVPGTFRKNPAT